MSALEEAVISRCHADETQTRIGLIIPSSNRMTEPQFHRYAPAGVAIHIARVQMTGRHKKPILIADIEGFWEPLRALFDHMRQLQFIRSGLTFNLLVANRVEDILPKLADAVSVTPEAAKEMAPAVAELMADWMTGRGRDEIFERFTVARFAKGETVPEDFIIG